VAKRERIGLFGGSFDPIHSGHLVLAENAAAALGLDRVLFMPTAVPPHKCRGDLTPVESRAEMVAAAIAGRPRFELSLIEAAPGVSYTYRSVLRFVDEGYRRDQIHLLIGSDSLEEMHEWRNPEAIFASATVVVMARPGHEALAALPAEAALVWLSEGATPISSTEVRRLAGEGKPIGHLVPKAVEEYIVSRSLYRGSG
jgi:nicotinate-nucleotide adenylyltransferase